MAISDTRFDTRTPGMTLADHLALARAPRLAPEQQWWNLPAKYAKAKQIAGEELARSLRLAGQRGLASAHNNALDAMRHAEWSRRMAVEIDPVTASIVGGSHELEGLMRGQPDAESLMDLRNNAEGRRAAAEGRLIDPHRLQVEPDHPLAANPAYPRSRPRGGGPGFR